MEIKRIDNSIIKKRKINFENLDKYDEGKMKQATEVLDDIINTSYISHFDNISFLLNQDKKLCKKFKSIGCIDMCKKLKNQLMELGLKTYFVSCKANGFSNTTGDLVIQEAHVFLLYPSIKDNKIFFTIFDPGFRMTNPLSFFDQENSINFNYINGTIKINFIEKNIYYPYELVIDKKYNYKLEVTDANIHWRFNPYYQTINIDEYCKKIYQVIFSLKLRNFPSDMNEYLCIRAKVLDQILEIYTIKKNQIFSFEYLSTLNIYELQNIFQNYFIDAKLDYKKLDVFINNLYLLVHNIEKYINNIIHSDVIEDYKLYKKLGR